MKSKVFIFSLFIVVFVVSLWYFKSPQKMDDLMLSNVEALQLLKKRFLFVAWAQEL